MQLRAPSAHHKYNTASVSAGGSISTHLIVDFVFSTLDSTLQESDSSSDGEFVCVCWFIRCMLSMKFILHAIIFILLFFSYLLHPSLPITHNNHRCRVRDICANAPAS